MTASTRRIRVDFGINSPGFRVGGGFSATLSRKRHHLTPCRPLRLREQLFEQLRRPRYVGVRRHWDAPSAARDEWFGVVCGVSHALHPFRRQRCAEQLVLSCSSPTNAGLSLGKPQVQLALCEQTRFLGLLVGSELPTVRPHLRLFVQALPKKTSYTVVKKDHI